MLTPLVLENENSWGILWFLKKLLVAKLSIKLQHTLYIVYCILYPKRFAWSLNKNFKYLYLYIIHHFEIYLAELD